MTGRVQSLRSSVSGNRPTGRQPGELYVNWADAQFGSVNASNVAQDLLPIRFFSALANYAAGAYVVQGNNLYQAKAAITAGAFNPTQWAIAGGAVTVADTAPPTPNVGQLWWDSVGGNLYVFYQDANSSQWVVAVNNGPTASITLPLMNGVAAIGTASTWARADHVHPVDTSLYPASNPAGYQTAGQVTASLNNYLPLAGGTLTGALGGTNATFSGTMNVTGNVNGASWVGNGGSVYPNYTANNNAYVAASATSITLVLNGNNYFQALSGQANIYAAGAACSWNGNTFTAANITVSGQIICNNAVYPSYTNANNFYLQAVSGNQTRAMAFSGAVYQIQCQITNGNTVIVGNSNSIFVLGYTGALTIAGALTQNSDIRGKKDVQDAHHGIEELRKIQPITYRRILDDPTDGVQRHRDHEAVEFGFSAQNVQEALPLATNEDQEGMLGVTLMPLIAALTNAVKQLDERLARIEQGAR